MPSLVRSAFTVCACLVLSALAACASAPSAPAPALAGTYVFTQANCRGDPPPADMPLLPLGDLQEQALVYVFPCLDSSLLVAYTSAKGVPTYTVYPLTLMQPSWQGGRLGLEWTRHSFEPGLGPSMPVTGKSFVSRTADGDLQVEWSFDEQFIPGAGGVYTSSGTHQAGSVVLLAVTP